MTSFLGPRVSKLRWHANLTVLSLKSHNFARGFCNQGRAQIFMFMVGQSFMGTTLLTSSQPNLCGLSNFNPAITISGVHDVTTASTFSSSSSLPTQLLTLHTRHLMSMTSQMAQVGDTCFVQILISTQQRAERFVLELRTWEAHLSALRHYRLQLKWHVTGFCGLTSLRDVTFKVSSFIQSRWRQLDSWNEAQWKFPIDMSSISLKSN